MSAVNGRWRPVGSGIRAFLLVATPLAFLGGAQVTLLSKHTEKYWAWTIALPISAIFIGASFLATAVLFAWGLSQREWIRVRAVVSGGPFVTVGLLVATLRHVDEFHSAVGVIWVEAYVFASVLRGRRPPVAGARSRPAGRGPDAGVAACGAGRAGRGDARSGRPAVVPTARCRRRVGMAARAAGCRDDRGVVAGHRCQRGVHLTARRPRGRAGCRLSYIVLGALWIGGAIFAGDAFHSGLDAVLYVVFAAGVIVVGTAGAVLSYREGRYLPLSGAPSAPASPVIDH